MGYGTCEETAVRVLAEEAPLYAGARLADCRDRGIPTSGDTEVEEIVDTLDTVDTEVEDLVDTVDMVDNEDIEMEDMVDTVNADIEVDTEDTVDAVLEAEKDTAVESEVVSMKLNMTTELGTEDTLPRSGKQLQEERKQKSEY